MPYPKDSTAAQHCAAASIFTRRTIFDKSSCSWAPMYLEVFWSTVRGCRISRRLMHKRQAFLSLKYLSGSVPFWSIPIGSMYAIYGNIVTFTINIPQMLAYIAYMDPMGYCTTPYLEPWSSRGCRTEIWPSMAFKASCAALRCTAHSFRQHSLGRSLWSQDRLSCVSMCLLQSFTSNQKTNVPRGPGRDMTRQIHASRDSRGSACVKCDIMWFQTQTGHVLYTSPNS